MDLQTIWFILIAILFIGYFFLEGFDFGVGILMPFVSKDDTDKRIVINSIGPFWDANEVWLITAGGAMFAAFPHWYATLFSGFYIPFFLMLLALIIRAVGFEFRSKMPQAGWRKTADWCIFLGSIIPPLLWGVAFTNILLGLPIQADMYFTASLWSLLNPYALLGGVVVVLMFALHGALFLSLRTTGEMQKRVEGLAKKLYWPIGIVALLFAVLGIWLTDLFDDKNILLVILPVAVLASYAASYFFINRTMFRFAFIGVALTIVLSAALFFAGMFPNVLLSSVDPAFNLTIYNASSSKLTLRIMAIVALIFVPVVLMYQGWSYYVFSKRISRESIADQKTS